MGGPPVVHPVKKGRHGVPHLSSEGSLCTRVPDYNGRQTLRKQTVRDVDGGEWAVLGESEVNFLVDTWSGVSNFVAPIWRQWGRQRDELTKYWG